MAFSVAVAVTDIFLTVLPDGPALFWRGVLAWPKPHPKPTAPGMLHPLVLVYFVPSRPNSRARFTVSVRANSRRIFGSVEVSCS